jgi:hypothetical protein
VSVRLKDGGLVWQQYLQPHVRRIELVLNTVLAKELRLLSDTASPIAVRMPKTIPVLNFQPEDWGDTVPCGYKGSNEDTERIKLYYMLYSIAGKKMVGEVCIFLVTTLFHSEFT